MNISNIEEYLKLDALFEAEERADFHTRFPHVVVMEGDFPEFGLAHRWCWANFGSQHGECIRWEYPSCPLVLATERFEMCEVRGWKWEKKVYDSVPRHCHIGQWALFWLGKTDYDHGFGEFCFTNRNQRDDFILQVPSFDWGENYPWLRE